MPSHDRTRFRAPTETASIRTCSAQLLDSRGLISLNGVDVLPAGRISGGLTMDYGRGLLRVADVGQKSTALVRDSFTGTFAFDCNRSATSRCTAS